MGEIAKMVSLRVYLFQNFASSTKNMNSAKPVEDVTVRRRWQWTVSVLAGIMFQIHVRLKLADLTSTPTLITPFTE